eukprot:jgi/Psemu1/18247/gm1.18247_g
MPFKKKRRASGNSVLPIKREKKGTLLLRQQKEATAADTDNDADLGGTGVNPTNAAKSTGRPSPRSIPQINYAEESTDNEEDIDPETYKEPTSRVATTQKYVRGLSIAVIFERVLGCPPQEDWQRLKTIAQICDCLSDNRRSFWHTVSQVCSEVLHCVDNETVYIGEYSNSGRPPVIAVDSIEAEIIADSVGSTPSRVWAQDARPEGAIYENELIKCISKLKGKSFEKLQQHNLRLVCDLKALSGNTSQIRTIAGSVSGISFEWLSAFVCAAEACLEGSPSPAVDHREASNQMDST